MSVSIFAIIVPKVWSARGTLIALLPASKARNKMDKRAFIAASATAITGVWFRAGIWPLPSARKNFGVQTSKRESLATLKRLFRLSKDRVHLSALFLASNPESVRKAIERYRDGIDADPVTCIRENNQKYQWEAVAAAAKYMGVRPEDIALSDSTTQGIGLVYNGIAIRADQEFLTTEHDYYSTHASLKYRSERSGAQVRKVHLYDEASTQMDKLSQEGLVDSILRSIRPETRVLALTWVHSSTGVKLPIRRISDRIKTINERRNEADRILLCVDGVHGLGVEGARVADLNCDFFMAGTHKWIFGPRGTGILWGAPEVQSQVTPTIPTFRTDPGWGSLMSPGGFKAFEHLWALKEAFEFHQDIGLEEVSSRIRSLCKHLKNGLADIRKVRLFTPQSSELSAGIVCFDIKGFQPSQTVELLRKRGIIATTTPYTPSHARLTPGIFNTSEEIDRALRAIRSF